MSVVFGAVSVRNLAVPVSRAALARLHGERCVAPDCEAVNGLVDAGYRYTVSSDGTRMGWPVRACPIHREGDDGDDGR